MGLTGLHTIRGDVETFTNTPAHIYLNYILQHFVQMCIHKTAIAIK